MRIAITGLLAVLGLAMAGSANASPAVPRVDNHNPKVILVAGGCGLGFHRTGWGCASNRYGFIVPGTAYYYPYSSPYYYPYYDGGYYLPYPYGYEY